MTKRDLQEHLDAVEAAAPELEIGSPSGLLTLRRRDRRDSALVDRARRVKRVQEHDDGGLTARELFGTLDQWIEDGQGELPSGLRVWIDDGLGETECRMVEVREATTNGPARIVLCLWKADA